MPPPDNRINVDGALDLAAKETLRRLEDDPSGIPNHVLFRFFADLNKMAERRAKEPTEDTPEFRLLDELHALPPERQEVLLDTEISRVTTELEQLLDARERLDDAGEEEPGVETPQGLRSVT